MSMVFHEKSISVKIFTRYCKCKYYNFGNDKSFVLTKQMFIALKVSTIITFAKHFSDRNSILVYIRSVLIITYIINALIKLISNNVPTQIIS